MWILLYFISILIHVIFIHSSVIHATLILAIIIHVNLIHASNANIIHTALIHAILIYTTLFHATLIHATLIRATLIHAIDLHAPADLDVISRVTTEYVWRTFISRGRDSFSFSYTAVGCSSCSWYSEVGRELIAWCSHARVSSPQGMAFRREKRVRVCWDAS